MKKIFLKASYIYLTLILLLSQNSLAKVEFKEPIKVYGQCEDEAVSATISPDAYSLSMLFDSNLLLEHMPGITTNVKQMKKCYFTIPLKASPNEKFEILGFDWRLFVGLPNSSKARFESKIWLTHNKILRNGRTKIITDAYSAKKKTMNGPLNSDLFMNQNFYEPKKVTECGADYFITIQVTMELKNKNKVTNAIYSLDSLDIGQSLSDKIVKRPCS